MDALVVDLLLDRHRGIGKGLIGRRLVADVPGEDMVGMLARALAHLALVFDILAQDRRVILKRLAWIDQHGELFVVDIDHLHPVGHRVAVLADHESDLLILEVHFFVGQNGLAVACECRHPVQVQRLQVVCRQHRDHSGHRLGRLGIDRLYSGVRIGAAHEIPEHLARQLDVIDVVAPALDEADVLLALSGAADAA